MGSSRSFSPTSQAWTPAPSTKRSWAFRLFFFFQAEDGIRALYVTGVQTCALPISRMRAGSYPPACYGGTALSELGAEIAIARAKAERSEERRVGKECRSRWSP